MLLLAFGILVSRPSNGKSAETADSHIGRGVQLLEQSRFEAAAREFGAALELEPHSRTARIQLGVCNFALRKFDEARKQFEELLREQPEDAIAVYFMGRLDLEERNFDRAISRLRRVAVTRPIGDTPFYLGQAYLKKGQMQEALEWLQKAAQAMPRDGRVYESLGKAYRQLGQEAEAEKAYATSERLRREDQEVSQQGVACDHDLSTQPLETAIQTCNKLFDPHHAGKLQLLGMLYGRHGLYAQALEPLQLAAALDPGSFVIQNNLGLAYFRLGRFQDAIAPLEKAVEIQPDLFAPNALLGASLLAVGENQKALETLRRAHRLKPEDDEVTQMLDRAEKAVARDPLDQKR